MPATITHAYFVNDVYDILPANIQQNCSLSRTRMFGQSMDALMFYHLFSPLPGKKIREFAGYFHRNESQDYFISLLDAIKEQEAINDVDVCSYLVGMICHYVLDSTVHPFVFYKTGVFDKEDPTTYKYNNVHEFMEVFLDNDMIKRRTGSNPYRFPIGKFCFDLAPFSNKLNTVIDTSFSHTFQLENMSKIYYSSCKQMKFALNTFRKDRFGVKKFIYKLCDTFTPKKMFRFEAISYHYPLKDRHNFLNQNHKLWRNPTTYDMTSTESFLDLYLKSIKIAKIIVCASFDYLQGKEINLKKIFVNKNYVTGLDCSEKKELKYFEF